MNAWLGRRVAKPLLCLRAPWPHLHLLHGPLTHGLGPNPAEAPTRGAGDCALHLLRCAWLDMGFGRRDILRDIPKRPFVPVGMLALRLLHFNRVSSAANGFAEVGVHAAATGVPFGWRARRYRRPGRAGLTS